MNPRAPRRAAVVVVAALLAAATPAMAFAALAPAAEDVPASAHAAVATAGRATALGGMMGLVDELGALARGPGAGALAPAVAARAALGLNAPDSAAGALADALALSPLRVAASATPAPGGDLPLTSAIAAYYAQKGFPAPDADAWDAAVAQERALDPDLARAMAAFVAALAAHDALVTEWDARAPAAPSDADREDAAAFVEAWLTPDAQRALAESALGAAVAADAVAARAISAAPTAADGGFLFRDPHDLVLVGDAGPNAYAGNTVAGLDGWTSSFNLLTVDLGGDDLYANNAGGAGQWPVTCPAVGCAWGGLAAAAIDVAGDDRYVAPGALMPVQGAGTYGGVGILMDLGGNDRYEARDVLRDVPPVLFPFEEIRTASQGAGIFGGVGLLLDAGGDDAYEVDVTHVGDMGFNILGPVTFAAVAQGAAVGGVGVLVDASGHDAYAARAACDGLLRGTCYASLLAQGAGSAHFSFGVVFITLSVGFSVVYVPFGVGALVDAGEGNDRYVATAHAKDHVEIIHSNSPYSLSSTVAIARAQGIGLVQGGVGVLFDGGGDDAFTLEAVAEGPHDWRTANGASSTWYYPIVNGQGAGNVGVGVLWSEGGDDVYVLRPHAASDRGVNAPIMLAQGASDGGGRGILIERGGNDRFVHEPGLSGNPASSTAIGWIRNLAVGFGAAAEGALGLFVDAGGDDVHEFRVRNVPEDPHVLVYELKGIGAADVSSIRTAGFDLEPGDAAAAFVDVGGANSFRFDVRDDFHVHQRAFGHGSGGVGVFLTVGATNSFEGFRANDPGAPVMEVIPGGYHVEA